MESLQKKEKTQQQPFLPFIREIRGTIAVEYNNRNNEKSTAEGIRALVGNDVMMQCNFMISNKFLIPCERVEELGII